MIKIGSYTPKTDSSPAIIERDATWQGDVFKDEEAYLTDLNKVCYVSKLSDTPITHQDILDLCNGQEELAQEVFYAIDWQSPSTYVDECLRNDEWIQCKNCGHIIVHEEDELECPKCHTEY